MLTEGMALQLERFSEARAAGMPRLGWKIGINVPEVQRHLRLPHSVVGWLDGGRSFPAGSTVPVSPSARIHAEPEVAIRVGRVVRVPATADAARDCIACIHPAIELVDYAKGGTDLTTILEHSMFHFASVVGEAHPISAAKSLGSKWPQLSVAGRSMGRLRDDLVPEDLGCVVAFVANYLAQFDQVLEASDLVFSGSFTAKAAQVSIGEEAVADFGPLGAVSAHLRLVEP